MIRLFTVDLCLLALFALGFSASAQSNYTPGYLINLQGDTLRGLLDDRGEAKNASEIRFKTSADAKLQNYLPTDLKGYYSSNDKYYVSREIAIEQGNGQKQPTAVFLEQLVKGRANLYYYKNYSDEIRYFVEKDTSGLMELIHRREHVHVPGQKTYERNDKRFLGLFKYLFSDCPTFRIEKYQNTNLELADVTRIVAEYNQCLSPETAQESTYVATKSKKKLKAEFTAVVLLNRATMVVAGYGTELPNPQQVWKYGAGFSINLFSPNMNDKVSLQLDAIYNTKGATSAYEARRFNFTYLDLSLLVKYHYPKGVVRPFAGAGFVYGTLLNRESAYTRKRSDGQQVNIFPPLSSLIGNEMGWCLDGGIAVPFSTHAVLLGYRFEKTETVSPIQDQFYRNQVHQLRLGYTF